MLDYFESAIDENIFLVVHCVTDTLITVFATINRIDSIFLFTPKTPAEVPSNVAAYCSTELSLVSELKKRIKNL
jgi:hypothetical protein